MADYWDSLFGWIGNVTFSFEYPWFLLLALVVPVLWIASYRPMANLGAGRRFAALSFRSVVMVLIILAVAGIQWVWISDKTTVVYLLDQSDSIPRATRDAMLKFAVDNVKKHRDDKREDRAGVIVFGREAAIEFPPYNDNLPSVQGVESYFGRSDATNLESALKLAQAAFPEDSAKRVVVITDGIETLGSATTVAQAMSETGIGIDVVPIRIASGNEVLVEKVDLPGNIRQGQPFDTRIVISRFREEGDNSPVTGKLKLIRSVGSQEYRVGSAEGDAVTLDKDIKVFTIQDTINQPAGYTYHAEFVPDDAADDGLEQNNRADAFTYVRGKGRVLLIEDANALGEFDALVQSLGRSEIEVDVQSSDQLFTSLGELQIYDCVILAGVPRSSGESTSDLANFSDEQLDMLVSNTEQFGCGLIMLGGPNGLGAGGWTNTVIEKAMPVDFQIKNKKAEAVGALAMILHASEIARGNYWQKRIGQSALEVLGPMDYCGVVVYGQLGDAWLWGGKNGMLRVGPNRQAMISRMRSMSPGDMPDFQPGMQMAYKALKTSAASIKHMIIISDGDPPGPTSGLLTQFKNSKIKISTVAVGAHGPVAGATLKNISNATGGNYYEATNPSALPKIFRREAMRVSRPLVFEPEGGVQPQITYPHEIVQGLSRDLPGMTGFLLTTVKDSPLVEVAIRANKPVEPENQTILASWTYGLGRTAVFTSDAGKLWANEWTSWEGYDQFFSQMVRWAMRPTKSDAKFTVATNVADGEVQVIVNALDQEDEFLNFLDMQAVAVGPDLKPHPLTMRQVAPGRYIGSFESDGAGSYLVNVVPGQGMAPITTGASVPFSDEYRIRKTNLTLLNGLAEMTPAGGEPGTISDPLGPQSVAALLELNAFRGGLPRAMSMQDIWHWCVLFGSVCLFGDVLVRRVAIDYLAPFRMVAKLVRRTETPQDTARSESLSRLRNTKTEVSGEIESARAATRFESSGEADAETLEQLASGAMSSSPGETKQSSTGIQQSDEQSSYTARLLAAKKAAQKKSDSQRSN